MTVFWGGGGGGGGGGDGLALFGKSMHFPPFMQVARDGYISFAETDSQLQPNDFPSLPYSVAPYWTPTRSIDPSGGVYYEVHVEDDDLLYEVSTLINRRMNNTQFNGKWMLVAYWKRVSPLLSALVWF